MNRKILVNYYIEVSNSHMSPLTRKWEPTHMELTHGIIPTELVPVHNNYSSINHNHHKKGEVDLHFQVVSNFRSSEPQRDGQNDSKTPKKFILR